jgi:hypothetical protein
LEERLTSAERQKGHKRIEYFLSLELCAEALDRFERELNDVVHTRDIKAFSAYQQLKKRWHSGRNGAHLTNGDKRVTGILNMLHVKVIEAALMKDGAAAVYREIDGNRLLSDEIFYGRLTANEIRLQLAAKYGPGVAGDSYAKEIRRTAKRLGVRLAKDKRGAKWKPPITQAENKVRRPVGRPRIRPEEIPTAYIENFSDDQGARDFQLVESDQFVESDQLVEASSFTEAYQFVVDDWARGGKAYQGQRAALGRFREDGLWDNYEARVGRELNNPVYLPPNPEGWWLPLSAEQRTRVPSCASFKALKRWMDNKRRASLPCLVGGFTRVKKLRRWLVTEGASDIKLFWNQWLTCGVKMPKAMLEILELKMESLHSGKRLARLVLIKTKSNTPLHEVQPHKESACCLDGSGGIALAIAQGA